MTASYSVTRTIRFCYGHRLIGHKGMCRNLHGHNGMAEITVSAEQLDDMGMVVDLGDIRDVVKGWIDANLDHRMILREDDAAVEPLRRLGEPMYLMDRNPTVENLARLIHEQTRALGIKAVEVRLWETPSSFAVYRDRQ